MGGDTECGQRKIRRLHDQLDWVMEGTRMARMLVRTAESYVDFSAPLDVWQPPGSDVRLALYGLQGEHQGHGYALTVVGGQPKVHRFFLFTAAGFGSLTPVRGVLELNRLGRSRLRRWARTASALVAASALVGCGVIGDELGDGPEAVGTAASCEAMVPNELPSGEPPADPDPAAEQERPDGGDEPRKDDRERVDALTWTDKNGNWVRVLSGSELAEFYEAEFGAGVLDSDFTGWETEESDRVLEVAGGHRKVEPADDSSGADVRILIKDGTCWSIIWLGSPHEGPGFSLADATEYAERV